MTAQASVVARRFCFSSRSEVLEHQRVQRDDEAGPKGRLDRDHKAPCRCIVWLSFISNRENVALAGV